MMMSNNAPNKDLEFLRQMIKHHEMALEMAREINGETKWAYIKNLSHKIYTTQKTEIEEMRQKARDVLGISL